MLRCTYIKHAYKYNIMSQEQRFMESETSLHLFRYNAHLARTVPHGCEIPVCVSV